MASRRRQNNRSGEPGRVQRAIATAIASGEIISVGVLNLVKNSLVTGLSGARDVGAEIGRASCRERV